MAYYERTYRFGFGGGLTQAVKYLLIINVAVFLLQLLTAKLLDTGPESLLVSIFGMHPYGVLTKFQIWQPFTYMFLHSEHGILHILINMFVLWMFGCEVERTLGTREFVKYYIFCGVGAGLCHILFNFTSTVPVVGASGAIYGVMMAFAVLFPERVITLLLFLFLPVQIKAKYLVMIFGGISLVWGILGTDNGVAHLAHLGGMLVGFAYLKLDWRLQGVGDWIRQQRESRVALQKLKKEQSMRRFREKVDELLDKINEVGYDNLSEEEKKILQEASQHFSEEQETEN
ncbi:rhomboid family intramembrane serine protease [bacterium]|nr:rhomboid family intramembrane serine protease [bacterium]